VFIFVDPGARPFAAQKLLENGGHDARSGLCWPR
jgi:hypothetical protein